ncbi:50S ribosomal protein L24 [bacterium]|nr:50S ribosomal protein L24 [bacterium]
MGYAIKKGDLVKVIAGKDKGKTGKIIRILPEKDRALVEKINMIKRHTRPNQKNPQGGIVEKEASIHISNLMYFDEKKNRTVRVGAKVDSKGNKVRAFKKAGEVKAE